MANDSISLTTPVGRLVEGSLYTPNRTDAEGKPLVVKTGANAGQPRVDYYFAVAIPKGSETHWAHTEWGKKIWDVGHKSFPNGQAQAPTFAWKITDGDSTVPNRVGRTPVSREGYKGCWVLKFSSGYPPQVCNAQGTAIITEAGAVKPGYYVQVAANVGGNGSMQQPGIYMNHSIVALSGYGPEIVFGPDPTTAGFGQSPLPAGASPVPVGAMTTPPVTATAAPAAPYVAPTPPATVAPPTVVVTPNPAFVSGAPAVAAVPPVAAAVAAPPPPPAAPPAALARVMLPKAGGQTYEAFIGAGWTDALLVQHGMMAA